MDDGIEDSAIEAVDLLVYFFPFDPQGPGVGYKLMREFINGDNVGLGRLRNVVRHPSMEKVDSARAHLGTRVGAILGSANS